MLMVSVCTAMRQGQIWTPEFQGNEVMMSSLYHTSYSVYAYILCVQSAVLAVDGSSSPPYSP